MTGIRGIRFTAFAAGIVRSCCATGGRGNWSVLVYLAKQHQLYICVPTRGVTPGDFYLLRCLYVRPGRRSRGSRGDPLTNGLARSSGFCGVSGSGRDSIAKRRSLERARLSSAPLASVYVQAIAERDRATGSSRSFCTRDKAPLLDAGARRGVRRRWAGRRRSFTWGDSAPSPAPSTRWTPSARSRPRSRPRRPSPPSPRRPSRARSRSARDTSS